MKTGILLSLIVGLMGFFSLEPHTGIEGHITELETGENLIGASVMLYDKDSLLTGVVTDLDGLYRFENLAEGTYDIEVKYTGFQTFKQEAITVITGQMTKVNMQMEDQGALLDCVEVVGYKVPLVSKDNTTSGIMLSEIVSTKPSLKSRVKNVFKRKQKSLRESLPTKNISQLAAKVAGVSVYNNSNISVRGSRANATHYYIDGVRVEAGNDNTSQASTSTVTEEERASSEVYDKPTENPFVSPAQEAFSTFSLDVDKASYSNVRRFLNSNQLPPADAVRVEEMINYFQYDYEEPAGEHPIHVKPAYTTCPWNKDHRLLHLSAKAKEVDKSQLPPSNLVYLVDVSGSMGSPNKLPLVVKSLKLLVEQLRPEDRVAIVTYAGRAGVALPSTSAKNKKKIMEGLEKLSSGGGTAGAQGIITAYEIAKKNFIKGGNNRVILATDGDFNIGVSNTSDLEKMIEKKRETGIFLSILGFGTGNYQDHKMQSLAGKGNGNHAYVDSYAEAKKVFINEFAGTLFTVAKDVKIQIEFNPAYVKSYRLIGYEDRMLAKEDFNDDKKDAGEVGAGHTVTAIYEIIPVGVENEFTASVDGEVPENRAVKQASANQALGYIKYRYKQPDADKSIKFEDRIMSKVSDVEKLDKDVQFSVSVAEFGMNIGQSKYLKTSDLNNCMTTAMKNKGKDKDGYRAEFIELIKKYMSLNSIAKS